VLGWLTFLAGGVYAWVWIPAGAAVLLITVAARPQIAREETRALDLALVAVFAACAIQLLPLPTAVVETLSPHAPALRRALFLPLVPAPSEGAWIPLSVVPGDSASGLGILFLAVLVFWSGRAVCEAGGVGRLIRTIAFAGLAASLAAIALRGRNIELLYGIWRPLDAGARPYGPFVNRNHLATWIIMASPLAFGYMLARAPRDRDAAAWSQRVARALKQLGSMRVWLATSVCLMTLAVLLSASRSGLIGLMTALLVSTLLSRGARNAAVRRWSGLQLALLALVILSFANYDVLLRRVEESVARTQEGRGRTAVWRDTLRMIGDFPASGTGAGTYDTAIDAYQTAEPGYTIGQAHNHYLQVIAEGGVLVGLPVALAGIAFAGLLARRLRAADAGDYFVKAGAAAGLAGVLVQSVWETGLTMPANAALCAVLAAVATSATIPPAAGSGDRC
jgi:hypothetical protein